MPKVAINGMGRIGRATFKILLDHPQLELVAVNDVIAAESIGYLLQYDSAYGKYSREIQSDAENLIIEGRTYRVLNEKEPANLPWSDLGIDLVFECSGLFTKKDQLEKHLQAGARKAILSAPAKSEGIPTVVHGVNHAEPTDHIISCASCTTNCIAPVVEIIGRHIGVKKATMSTVHAYTATQAIVDTHMKKPRRGRAGAANFIPTSTGAAIATTKVLPQYADKFDGVAIRGPVIVGSIADIIMLTGRATSVEEIKQIFREEAVSQRYQGVVGITDDPIVSSDIIMDSRASVVDLEMTRVTDGDLVKVMSWYDNEWGYSNQMVREAIRMSRHP
jgi:glyceraldehyde 3-phosphate dehydrogenase